MSKQQLCHVSFNPFAPFAQINVATKQDVERLENKIAKVAELLGLTLIMMDDVRTNTPIADLLDEAWEKFYELEGM